MHDTPPPTSPLQRRRAFVGGAIVIAAVGMLFWWGSYFRVFGSKIDWLNEPTQLGLVGWLVVASFGAGYAADGVRAGLKAMKWTASLLLAGVLFSVVRGAI